MEMRKFMLAFCLLFAWVAVMAQNNDAELRDKITNAVMRVYDEQLAKDPNDYNTLFARAHQNYYNGDFVAALADVNQAMLITPKKDKDLRFDEHILRARISEARNDYASEIADLKLALELKPKSLACTDMLAKANLKAGNLDAAQKAFETILRAESRNYDAMYGLALVEQARNHSTAALAHVNKAVELFRNIPQVYENRADILAKQGNIEEAVQNLVLGMSMNDGGNAAQCLFDMSDDHYAEVMSALGNLAMTAEDGGAMCRFLRANIAIDHSRFGQALRDLNYIKRNHLYDSDVIYYDHAKCLLELARFDEALTSIDLAIGRNPMQPEFYIVKALAAYYAGGEKNYQAAMDALDQCSHIAPQHVPMLLTKAALLASQGMDKDALGYLNAAVANEPANAEARIARGLTLKRLGGYDELAAKDFNVMTLLGDDMYNLKGFALSELERDVDAFKWINAIEKEQLPGGENFYCLASLMAAKGDNFKAMSYLQQALDKGYGSLFKLQYDDLSPLNIKSLRSEPEFEDLLLKANRNFVEAD
jgi:tetratricopeptide (TPR) repeat protein